MRYLNKRCLEGSMTEAGDGGFITYQVGIIPFNSPVL